MLCVNEYRYAFKPNNCYMVLYSDYNMVIQGRWSLTVEHDLGGIVYNYTRDFV